MCRATVGDKGGFWNLPPLGGRKRLEVRAFYLRLSSSSAVAAAAPPAELTLVYRPAIGSPALGFRGRALPPASPAESTLLRVRVPGDDDAVAAYASNDRVSASEGARFEVYAGKELAAEGVFFFGAVNRARGGWRVECRRVITASPAVVVAEVVVLAEGGVLFSAKASAAARRCATRLEGIPEEASSWGSSCECGTCSEDWEVVGDDSDDEWKKEASEMETETVRWALEMGAWAVCVGVGLLATARRFRRRRAFR